MFTFSSQHLLLVVGKVLCNPSTLVCQAGPKSWCLWSYFGFEVPLVFWRALPCAVAIRLSVGLRLAFAFCSAMLIHWADLMILSLIVAFLRLLLHILCSTMLIGWADLIMLLLMVAFLSQLLLFVFRSAMPIGWADFIILLLTIAFLLWLLLFAFRSVMLIRWAYLIIVLLMIALLLRLLWFAFCSAMLIRWDDLFIVLLMIDLLQLLIRIAILICLMVLSCRDCWFVLRFWFTCQSFVSILVETNDQYLCPGCAIKTSEKLLWYKWIICWLFVPIVGSVDQPTVVWIAQTSHETCKINIKQILKATYDSPSAPCFDNQG